MQENFKEYGTPKQFAITMALEGIKNQIIILQDEIDNEEIVGSKKKYLQALFNLNNKLVEQYNKNGDATGYYLEWNGINPNSVALK
jgi:hypothetical protein|tara:strand:- start:202 stop:459 length:258 start_codon:yes stop_codon:yes gene_type:complete